jgi:DNA adenine methylase
MKYAASELSLDSSIIQIAPVMQALAKEDLGSTPILRWAGSKKKLLPTLTQALPTKINAYREPFVGSGVLFLRTTAKNYVLSDINAQLIEMYEVVRQKPRAIWRLLRDLPTHESFYYDLRGVSPDCLNKTERAVRFLYLNRFCFNGVYRTNRIGHFNVSRGMGHLFIPTEDVFVSFANKLKTADVRVADFETIVDEATAGDLVYLDPPYAEEQKRDRGEYGPNAFKVNDLSRLITSIKRADKRGVRILLSYSARFLNLDALKGWAIRDIQVMRNVAGFASNRKIADEIIVSNYKW